MKKYDSIKKLAIDLEKMNHAILYKELNKDLLILLELLEKINPCNQKYEIYDDTMIVSYILKINLFNFTKHLSLNTKAVVIGLPISISEKGYWGKQEIAEKIIKQKKGLIILLNSDKKFSHGGRTLSTFIFENKYLSFNEYLENLRSSYRRRINKALSHRKDIEIRLFDKKDFNEKHYKLYLSIMSRTESPLETLPIEFFTEYNGELYEFIDIQTKEVVAFIQLKQKDEKLCFLFGGFKKEDNEIYDIYYNMLVKIIEIGIEKQVKLIEFGQTAEESKTKIGCKEISKYLYVHHSNKTINYFIQKLIPFFSYKPYNVKHHVFKNIKQKI